LGTAWEEKKRLSPRISTPYIDELYAAALASGALGGKVTGAGGGGYILFYCDYRRRHRVVEMAERMGAHVSEFAFEPRGLSTWRIHGD
jgi:D-glycero-alpha-D-manno-heptose-7-phosphate kinase